MRERQTLRTIPSGRVAGCVGLEGTFLVAPNVRQNAKIIQDATGDWRLEVRGEVWLGKEEFLGLRNQIEREFARQGIYPAPEPAFWRGFAVGWLGASVFVGVVLAWWQA